MRARGQYSQSAQGRRLTCSGLLIAVLFGGLACSGGGGGGGTTITGPGNIVTGSGVTVTEAIPVSGISGVSISSVGLLIIEQSGSESLTVTAEENILPLITVDVVGDLLILGIEPNTQVNTSQGVVYRLNVVELDRITLSGATQVEAAGLNSNYLEVTLSGASTAVLAGTAERQRLIVSGASRCDAAALSSRFATVDISGASSAIVRVSELLEGQVTGAAVLEYYGNPVVDISGGATVRRLGG